IKTIGKSRTYQLAVTTNKWNDGDDINCSPALARRLAAEVLYDAIHRVTGAQSRLPGLPPGSRAAQVLDGSVDLPSGFLDLFGKPVRESACECERSNSMMLGPVLNLVNGPIVGDALRNPNNRLSKIAEANKDDRKFVEEVYLAVLNRMPSPRELELGLRAINDGQADHAAQVADHHAKMKVFQGYEKQVDARQPAWEKSIAAAPVWEAMPVSKVASVGKARLVINTKENTVLATGTNPDKDTYTITFTTKLPTVTGLRLEVLRDDGLPARGRGRAQNGNFVLNEFPVTAAASDKPMEAKPVALHKAVADFSQDSWKVAGAIDNNPATGWAVLPQIGKA